MSGYCDIWGSLKLSFQKSLILSLCLSQFLVLSTLRPPQKVGIFLFTSIFIIICSKDEQYTLLAYGYLTSIRTNNYCYLTSNITNNYYYLTSTKEICHLSLITVKKTSEKEQQDSQVKRYQVRTMTNNHNKPKTITRQGLK